MYSTKKNEHKLILKVREFLRHRQIPRHSRIIIAFSGGPDSTALLYSLYYLKDEWPLSLSCAYLNHGLRSLGEIEKEMSHIKKTIKHFGLNIAIQQCKHGELAKQARSCKRSLEETA